VNRDRKTYQIMINGQPKPVADATREELEDDLMRAYDVIQLLEVKFAPLGLLMSDFIEGRHKQVDEATKDVA
jgi:hypothetical protein